MNYFLKREKSAYRFVGEIIFVPHIFFVEMQSVEDALRVGNNFSALEVIYSARSLWSKKT